MAYILLGFSVAGLSVCAFFLLFDQGRWLHGSARRGQDKAQEDLSAWTDQADSVAPDAGETAADEIGGREGLATIFETRFALPEHNETEKVDPSFQWGKYTLRELEANSAAEVPSLKNELKKSKAPISSRL